MPNKYVPHPDSRAYRRYSDEKLEACLTDIATGKMSERKASAHYNIPRQTIRNKTKGLHSGKIGGQKVFSDDEGKEFVQHISCVANLGFPITKTDFRFIVKSYLDKKKKNIKCFKNNYPGREWCNLFLKRHDKELRERFAHNISKKRANVTEKIVIDFFDHLEQELDGVPPENIFNFDETGINDDPRKKKVIFSRKSKHPQLVVNSSKVNYSVMFCGTANGEVLPPYVVYKGTQPLVTWTQGGPPGTRYAASKSGWFEQATFENWFDTVLYPELKKKDGQKVIICDNLTSHISLYVLRQCDKVKTKFICLPPNSTHILQPFDVSFFSPLKSHWRKLLHSWKQTKEGKKYTTVTKQAFPELLHELLKANAPKASDNVRAGFRKTGIYPTDRRQPIGSLPEFGLNDLNISDGVGQAFQEYIEHITENFTSPKSTSRKRLPVEPGKSISSEEVAQYLEESALKKKSSKSVKGKL
ncbi:uncharacterized protein LOC134528877 [Bacillus rossius redtenbacheri]|uniref:uncharacterized protein LOC134528877 n=1 Tax=Bacillus rossius redtenbacheri TaxID=93214 RepID=UPI002FDD5DBF